MTGNVYVYGKRCRACGSSVGTVACRAHPKAELIDWNPEMVRAFRALDWAVRNGREIGEFVETFSPDYYPGVSKALMGLAAIYWQSWGGNVPELSTTTVAAAITPLGLYGARP